MDFFWGNCIGFEVVLKFDGHGISKFFFEERSRYYGKAPRLAVMRGWGKCCSGENALDHRIRYGVRFEAADRASSPQKGMKISGGQSELV